MRKFIFALVAAFGLCVPAMSAVAYPTLPAAVLAQYPNATNLNTCGTCHNDFTGPSAGLNPYGTAFFNADGLSDPAAAMTAIENDDSDGDGTANGAEMSTGAGFLPGWSCDTINSAVNAPNGVLDYVDPANVGCSGAGTTTTTTIGGGTTTTTSGGGTTSTTIGGTTTTTTGGVTTTTIFGAQNCSQPVTTGPTPTASDCLFILRSAVGSSTCDPACICDVNAAGGITATDALVCLKKAVGQSVDLNCQCGGTTTTTTGGTTTTTTGVTTTTTGATTTTTIATTTTTTGATTTTTTGGGGSIAAGQADYDARCSFCHAAGSHDTTAELASDLAGKGDNLVPDLGTIDSAMTGITLTNQQLLDMAAFLNSL